MASMMDDKMQMMKLSNKEELPDYSSRSIIVLYDKEKQQNSSIFRALKQNEETEGFAGLLEKMDYAVIDPYASFTTIFVPSTKVIKKVAQTLPNNFFNLKSTLELLKYHVSNDAIDPQKLKNLNMLLTINTNLSTEKPKVICAQRNGTEIKLNNYATIKKVIKSTNMDDKKFVFFVIDKILSVPDTFECL